MKIDFLNCCSQPKIHGIFKYILTSMLLASMVFTAGCISIENEIKFVQAPKENAKENTKDSPEEIEIAVPKNFVQTYQIRFKDGALQLENTIKFDDLNSSKQYMYECKSYKK